MDQNQIIGLMALGDAFSSLGAMGGGPQAQSRALPLAFQMQAKEQAAAKEAEATKAFMSALGMGPIPDITPQTSPNMIPPTAVTPVASPQGNPNFNFDTVRDALVRQESGGNPNAVSPKGATGLTQIMPATARDPGYGVPNIFDTARQMGIPVADESDATLGQLLRNPQVNEAFGGNYFNAMSQKYGGDPAKTLAAYNAGPGAVDQYGGVPPFQETQDYVAAIAPQATQPAPAAPSMPQAAPQAGRSDMFPPEIRRTAGALLASGDRQGAKDFLTSYVLKQSTTANAGPKIIKGADGFNYTQTGNGWERTIPGVESQKSSPIAALEARADAAGLVPGSEERRTFMLNDGKMPDEGIDYKAESELRKEFNGLATVKAFRQQATAFGRIQASAQDPSAAGDLALIFNFMKVLDPASVVRESEFATAEQAAAWLESAPGEGISIPRPVASSIRKLQSGQRLSEGQRQDFVGRAGSLYSNAENQYDEIYSQYRGIAERRNFDPNYAVVDYRYKQAPVGEPVMMDGYKIEVVE